MLLSILSIFSYYIRVYTQILRWMIQTFLSIIVYKHIVSKERRRALYRRHRFRLRGLDRIFKNEQLEEISSTTEHGLPQQK